MHDTNVDLKADFAVVTIENGVGMGLVINNRLYRGTHGMGLELGHTKVQLDGALRREAALDADDESQLVGSNAMLETLFEKAKGGNPAAETIFRRAGHYLSIGLANIVQLFDPPLIVLSGRRTRYDYLYAEEVLAEMHKLTLTQGRQPCEVKIHFWQDLDWARGATVPALSALTNQMVGGLEVSTS